jgi:predicted alpha/beta hydrolase
VKIRARDGYELGGDLYLPAGEPRAAALIAGAMAVRARFYKPFATFLAERGIAALTVDYRGVGASRAGPLRGFSAAMHEWGELDLGGAVDFLQQRFPSLPLLWVGHSCGGQLMGLLPDAPVRAALFVSCQSGYWRNWSGLGRAAMFSLWNAVIPLSCAVYGYLPFKLLGQGEDVPRGVALEWARWGRDPHYIYSYAQPRGGLGFARYAGPLRSIAVSDDSYAPRPAVEALLEMYSSARRELQVVEPDGVPIGHFGFFKQRARWSDAADWLVAGSD